MAILLVEFASSLLALVYSLQLQFSSHLYLFLLNSHKLEVKGRRENSVTLTVMVLLQLDFGMKVSSHAFTILFHSSFLISEVMPMTSILGS
ncbi:hypothetical protein SLA2020_013830 [Shorea laevis]